MAGNFFGCVDTRKKYDESKQELRLKQSLERTASALVIWASVGWGGLMLYASYHGCPVEQKCPTIFDMFSSGLLLSLASGSIGGLLGFLFGIPRTARQGSQEGRANVPDAAKTSGAGTTLRQGEKTNIEENADWLTKILVGAGLVELQNMG